MKDKAPSIKLPPMKVQNATSGYKKTSGATGFPKAKSKAPKK